MGDEGVADHDTYDGPRETLSEFVARLLNQLSLSAWLPSAALVLIVAMVQSTGLALAVHDSSPGVTLSRALDGLSHLKAGDLVLLGAAVVVLTMLTQAFSFETIRALEGYWGTWTLMERLAERRVNRHRRRRRRLVQRESELGTAAWPIIRQRIETQEASSPQTAGVPAFTENMFRVLEAQVKGRAPSPAEELEYLESQRLLSVKWVDYAPADIQRRFQNLRLRLEDFPIESQMLPTRLGNVLRHFEDETGVENVESLVQELFELLPFSLRVEHDEQRTRLDLYASMVAVQFVAVACALVRFHGHVGYQVGAVLVGAMAARVSYAAAIASARYYGRILVRIAAYAQSLEVEDDDELVEIVDRVDFVDLN